MEHARYLLEEKTMPVNDIASYVGYRNSNSFTRAFTRKMKQSPTAYRSNNGKKTALTKS